MNIPYLCVGLLGLLVVVGGFYVSICRARAKIVQGYPDDPAHPLHKAVRAHGNTIEYAPMIAVMIAMLSQGRPPIWVVFCMIGATLGRWLIFFGLAGCHSLARPNPIRAIGALMTYVFGALLALYLVYVATMML